MAKRDNSFDTEIRNLKKQFDTAFEVATLINQDRLKHLDQIDGLLKLVAKYDKALREIARQKTCHEQESDEYIPIGSDGTRLGDINMAYDCIIEVARKALNIQS